VSKIPATIEITDAKFASNFTLALTFSDGKKHCVDFASFLKTSQHPEVQKYLNPKQFKRYSIWNGDLMWGDFDLIFPVADLYQKTQI
jgi:hypothetical protein